MVWSGKAPYKFKGSYGEKTSTLSDALGSCATDKKCKGVNFNGKTYQRTKTTTAVAAVGYTAFKKGGALVSNRGYMWDHRTKCKLTSGYYNSITYKTDSAAMKVRYNRGN